MNGEMIPTSVDQELSAIPNSDEQTLILTNAANLATDVARLIKDRGLSKRLGGSKDHVMIEGWLTIARVQNEQPHSRVIRIFQDSKGHEIIEAEGYLTKDNGRVVCTAHNYVSTEEANWKDKPFYARASMAQTRALAKALRNRHAWVMVMAGFETTPAEEMDGVQPAAQPARGPVVEASASVVGTQDHQPDGWAPSKLTPDLGPIVWKKGMIANDLEQHPCKICKRTDFEVMEGSAKSKNPGRLYLACADRNCKDGTYRTFGGFVDEVMAKYDR